MNLDQPGSILRLEVKALDYNMAEIVHIIAHRPGNLLFIHKDAYKTFVKQIVAL